MLTLMQRPYTTKPENKLIKTGDKECGSNVYKVTNHQDKTIGWLVKEKSPGSGHGSRGYVGWFPTSYWWIFSDEDSGCTIKDFEKIKDAKEFIKTFHPSNYKGMKL